MKYLLKIILTIFISFLALNLGYAEKQEENIDNKIRKSNIFELLDIKKNININEKLKIDLTKLEEKLKNKYNSNILFEWNITGENTINGSIFEKQFKTFGEKELNLNIYKINGRNRKLISNKKINIFVYKTKIKAIFEKDYSNDFSDFIKKAKESGVFIEKYFLDKDNILKFNFNDNILNKLDDKKYFIVWGGKDFMFDILSAINTLNPKKKINIVGISGFNIKLLKSFLQNFISNKTWLEKAIILDESSKFEILKQPNDIDKLKEDIIKNNYNYVDLNSKSKINNLFFVSKFVNILSNSGFSVNNIYMILIIPFLLLGVIVFKHLIGLTPAGILIPVAMTLLFLKLGIITTAILIFVFFITNLILSKIISKYSLHYSPKIVLLTIINIITFIVTINILQYYNLIKININDIMLIIFFILIAEKLVNIIVSKEFGEYKMTLINTLIFAFISFIFFKITFIKTFILSYPETILILIPIAFIIGRFTGLRVTEYFRFREVIKSIEE